MIELVNISLICSSKRINNETICAYCRNDLDDLCNFCINSKNDCICKTVIGVCSHEYHQHCIDSWIKRVPMCPLCKSKWIIEKIN